jgi:hypothetical protein
MNYGTSHMGMGHKYLKKFSNDNICQNLDVEASSKCVTFE